MRDPHGFRPLSLGKLDGKWVLSSESCAFDLIQAEFVRDVRPGEVVIIDKQGMRSMDAFQIRNGGLSVFSNTSTLPDLTAR